MPDETQYKTNTSVDCKIQSEILSIFNFSKEFYLFLFLLFMNISMQIDAKHNTTNKHEFDWKICKKNSSTLYLNKLSSLCEG